MSGQKSNNSKKVFCNCSKCCKKDTERGGLLILKSTRTRHRKQENEKQSDLDSTLSFTTSDLSLSDVYFSSESESSVLIDMINATYVAINMYVYFITLLLFAF